MRTSTRLAATAICVVIALAGCTDTDTSRGGSGEQATTDDETVVPTTSTPEAALTVIADVDPALAAISTSRALFDSSALVVLADPSDLPTMALGASAAVVLGVPLLLSMSAPDATAPSSTTPGSGSPPADASPLNLEFQRLGVSSVLAVGDAAAQAVSAIDGVEVVGVPAEPESVTEALGIELVETDPQPVDGLAAAFAGLDPASPVALVVEAGPGEQAPTGTGTEAATLPPVTRPEPVTATLVLTTTAPEALAGIATARAAGAAVTVLAPDQLDPRATSEAITALTETRPGAVIALGAGYAEQQGLDWKLATASTGAQFPGGGQLLFAQRTFIALYGYTEGGALGVLGEQDANGAVQRATDLAAQYQPLLPDTVVPTFEIIATVASEFAGPDGNYSTEAPISQLQPWVDAAGAAGVYVVLDLQPGRTDFLTQAKLYEPLLRLPHVGLALDPEWRLLPDQVHLRQIGFVSIQEVNAVVTWLADLTRSLLLPQKALVLHQFQVGMIPDRASLDTTREELAILIHVDGNGSQGSKQDTWRVLHQNPPANVYWGWKNFIDEDSPVLTPEQTIAQALPTPELITYQ